jgi:4-amino-4-deoxy-L-arabinose transferase-like glycosyltransferase
MKSLMHYIRRHKTGISLGLILALTAFLSFYAAWEQGYANSYYTAAVKSMLTSWHNFFFASFDPGGFISVDKPPMGLWLQAAFAGVFGVYGWSVILPEALCAVGSVAVLYHLVQRKFGKTAGLIAALVLSLSPIFIAVARTNNLDSSLILMLLLAAWPMMIAAEKGSLRHLLLSMVLLGLAFNIKTLQAFLVLPALLCVYFFTAQTGWLKRVWHLLLGLVVLAGVSLSWILIVDATPADARPYVGGSSNNSEMELMSNYNGINRLMGNMGGGMRGGNFGNSDYNPEQERTSNDWRQDRTRGSWQGEGNNRSDTSAQNQSSTAAEPEVPLPSGNNTMPFAGFGGDNPGNPPENFNGNGGAPGGGNRGGGGGMNEGGQVCVFRFFNEEMGGQISWLIPLALFSMLALALCIKKKDENRKNLRALAFWGIWLVTMLVFFSVAGFFHRYYLSMLAPAIAALCGIAAIYLWRFYKEDGWKRYLLPAGIAVTAGAELFLLSRYPAYSAVLSPVLGILAFGAAVALIVFRLQKKQAGKIARLLAAIGLAALLIIPGVWSFTPIAQGTNTQLPVAGPELGQGGGRGNMGRGGPGRNRGGNAVNNRDAGRGSNLGGTASRDIGENSTLIEFLTQNNSGEKYLVAVNDANSAAPIILATGKPVVAAGGFGGNDPALTLDQLKRMVEAGELRFYITSSSMGSNSDIISWVQQNGKALSQDKTGYNGILYDLNAGKGLK